MATNAANGIYNYGAGAKDTATDRGSWLALIWFRQHEVETYIFIFKMTRRRIALWQNYRFV